jgi:aminoglycoside phosphotransferase (APT) family kinase protein
MTDGDLSEAYAHVLLQRATDAAGLSADDARLLRIGSNAVFHLTVPVVVRVSRAGDLERARRTVSVARWLESLRYPAVRAVDVAQPVELDGHAVTFWESVSERGDRYAPVADVAKVIADLHKLHAPAYLDLPRLAPFDGAAKRIDTSGWLDPDDRTFLTGQLASLRDSYGDLEFALPQGVIHGDANVGNVLLDRLGNPVVIDLDGFAIGPREWDLALTAIYYDSFGWHTREEYQTFADVYGFDVMRWPGYPVMRAVREFLMTTWIVQQAADSPRAAAEAAKRLAALRTGVSRKDWQPF